MIKRLLIGAAIGFFGKKMYDEGKLDPYIAKAKAKLDECTESVKTTKSPEPVEPEKAQPDVAF